jgi:hypothetical protein
MTVRAHHRRHRSFGEDLPIVGVVPAPKASRHESQRACPAMVGRAFAACRGCVKTLGIRNRMRSGARAFRAHEKRCRPPFPPQLPESIAAMPAANSSQDQHVGPQLQRIELVKFSLTALHRKCGRSEFDTLTGKVNAARAPPKCNLLKTKHRDLGIQCRVTFAGKGRFRRRVK